MNNFLIDIDFQIGFVIGASIYITAVILHRLSKRTAKKKMVYYE